jgi:hypothetical protein
MGFGILCFWEHSLVDIDFRVILWNEVMALHAVVPNEYLMGVKVDHSREHGNRLAVLGTILGHLQLIAIAA